MGIYQLDPDPDPHFHFFVKTGPELVQHSFLWCIQSLSVKKLRSAHKRVFDKEVIFFVKCN